MVSECKNKHRECQEDIMQQIEKENILINNRITWMLQINGFIFAAISLLKIKESTIPIIFFVHFILPYLGLGLSVFVYLGVRAAQRQVCYLKEKWEAIEKECPCCLRPFGDKHAHLFGSMSSYCIPIILISAWSAFIVASSIYYLTWFVVTIKKIT